MVYLHLHEARAMTEGEREIGREETETRGSGPVYGA